MRTAPYSLRLSTVGDLVPRLPLVFRNIHIALKGGDCIFAPIGGVLGEPGFKDQVWLALLVPPAAQEQNESIRAGYRHFMRPLRGRYPCFHNLGSKENGCGVETLMSLKSGCLGFRR